MQLKKLLFCFCAAALFSACGGTEMKNPGQVEARQEKPDSVGPIEALKNRAIHQDDAIGQVKWGLSSLQKAYDESAPIMDGLGEVKVLLDDNFILSIQNNINGGVLEQRVNLQHLKADLKSFEWIVDKGDVIYPGVKIPVLEGMSGVENLSDGVLKETKPYLEIVLAERAMVQKVVSGMLNSIRASRGEALERN